MCGIAAIFGIHHPEHYKQSLISALRHRGPDGEGSFVHKQNMLVHTRLAIIDTSSAGNQPLFNEDKTIALVCNGEIYNFQELRVELETKGHVFASNSDSEIIIHLYEEYGHEPTVMLNKLRGMFAFALYDEKKQQALLARDRFGIKPLYYYQNGSSFVFASEMGAIKSLPFVDTAIDYTSLYEYVQFLSVPEPNTIYHSIKAVKAGSYWLIGEHSNEHRIWYDTVKVLSTVKEIEQDAPALLTEKLQETIGLHMVADVPVGSFLSAGIDSTLVTKIAAACTNLPFTTVSASFAGTQEDENEIAAQTSSSLGLHHVAVDMRKMPPDRMQRISSFFDQPFAVASAYSLFDISKVAARHMKVVLTGDGGDEVFAGYDYKHQPFYKHPLLRKLPAIFHPLMKLFLQMLPVATAKSILHDMQLSNGDRFLNRSRVFTPAEALQLINPSLHQLIDTNRFKRQVDSLFVQMNYLPVVRQLLIADMMTFLKSEMLYKVDRMTMANGIEARVPLLDHELVELAFGIPLPLLRNEMQGKLLLRNMVAVFLPAIASREKTGFNTPKQTMPSYLVLSANKRIANLLNLQDYSSWPDEKKFYIGYLKSGIESLALPEENT